MQSCVRQFAPSKEDSETLHRSLKGSLSTQRVISVRTVVNKRAGTLDETGNA